MKVLKDILYTSDNSSLDLGRMCSAIANIGYWAVVAYGIAKSGAAPDLSNLGIGWAAMAAGCAAWIASGQIQDRRDAE